MKRLVLLLIAAMLLSGCVTSSSYKARPRGVVRHYNNQGKRVGISYVYEEKYRTVIQHYNALGKRTGTSYYTRKVNK